MSNQQPATSKTYNGKSRTYNGERITEDGIIAFPYPVIRTTLYDLLKPEVSL